MLKIVKYMGPRKHFQEFSTIWLTKKDTKISLKKRITIALWAPELNQKPLAFYHLT